METVTINISLPKNIADYIDREAEEHYLARASVARKYLMEEITQKIVVEARTKGYSIRKIADVTGISYLKVLHALEKSQIDQKIYPNEEE